MENHAEINAIESVKNKDDLEDSTLFVTLEPVHIMEKHLMLKKNHWE